MAVKWKPSATAFCALCLFLIIVPNAFVNSVRVQSKRVKGTKGIYEFFFFSFSSSSSSSTSFLTIYNSTQCLFWQNYDWSDEKWMNNFWNKNCILHKNKIIQMTVGFVFLSKKIKKIKNNYFIISCIHFNLT